jgi:hypothetical protein
MSRESVICEIRTGIAFFPSAMMLSITREEQYSRSWKRPFARQERLLHVESAYAFAPCGAVPAATAVNCALDITQSKTGAMDDASLIFALIVESNRKPRELLQ